MGATASVLSVSEYEQSEAIKFEGHDEYIGWPIESVEGVLEKYEQLEGSPPCLLRSEWFQIFCDFTVDRGDGTGFLRLPLE